LKFSSLGPLSYSSAARDYKRKRKRAYDRSSFYFNF
jgi:hypothetical protein